MAESSAFPHGSKQSRHRVSGTKLSEGELCHPRPFEPEFCAVVVIRPEELKKNRPNVPFHPRLRDISGREMASPFNFSV